MGRGHGNRRARGPVDSRLQRDVIPYRPTVLTIMLGMNDGQYQPEDEARDKVYFDGYRHIVESIESALPGIRITAIAPSAYDDVTRPVTFPGGYNETLISFSKWITNLGEQKGLTVIDFNTPVVDALKRAAHFDAEKAQELLPDRVHPGFAMSLVMAEALLKAWGARATVVAVT